MSLPGIPPVSVPASPARSSSFLRRPSLSRRWLLLAAALVLMFAAIFTWPPLMAGWRVRGLIDAPPARAEELRRELAARPSSALSWALADLVRDRLAPYAARTDALTVLTLTRAAHADAALRDLASDPAVADGLARPALEELSDRGVDIVPIRSERARRRADGGG